MHAPLHQRQRYCYFRSCIIPPSFGPPQWCLRQSKFLMSILNTSVQSSPLCDAYCEARKERHEAVEKNLPREHRHFKPGDSLRNATTKLGEESYGKVVFSFETGMVPVLFLTAAKYRHPHIRRAALALCQDMESAKKIFGRHKYSREELPIWYVLRQRLGRSFDKSRSNCCCRH
jgi:hypothetical protein